MKLVQPLKREPSGGAASSTIRSSSIESFDLVLPFGRGSPPDAGGGCGSVALSIPLGLIFGRPGPTFEPRNLVALRRNRSPQLRHLFQQLQHQALEISVGKAIEVCGRRHAHNESDSCPLGNRIILPSPRVLPLLLNSCSLRNREFFRGEQGIFRRNREFLYADRFRGNDPRPSLAGGLRRRTRLPRRRSAGLTGCRAGMPNLRPEKFARLCLKTADKTARTRDAFDEIRSRIIKTNHLCNAGAPG
jgi:hypothetical protein